MSITIFQSANRPAFDLFKATGKLERFLKSRTTDKFTPTVTEGKMPSHDPTDHRFLLKTWAEHEHRPRVSVRDALSLLQDAPDVHYYIVEDATEEDNTTFYLLDKGPIFEQLGVEL